LGATNQRNGNRAGREALATTQRTINRTGGALQPLSEASTGCGTVFNQSAMHQPPLLELQEYRRFEPSVNAF